MICCVVPGIVLHYTATSASVQVSRKETGVLMELSARVCTGAVTAGSWPPALAWKRLPRRMILMLAHNRPLSEPPVLQNAYTLCRSSVS